MTYRVYLKMIHIIRNILIVLMITVNFMSFTHAARPTNEGFKKCTENMMYGFTKLFDMMGLSEIKGQIPDSDLFDPDSRVICISSAILDMTKHETYNIDRKGYYDKFPGHAKPDKIDAKEKFCTDWTDFLPVLERQDEYDKCIVELEIFGTVKGEILNLALSEFRITLTKEEKSFTFWERTYRNRYMRHISKVIELDPNSDLVTPGQYCIDNHPDNPDNQTSSSNKKLKY